MNVGRQLDDGRDRANALSRITMGAGKTVKAGNGPGLDSRTQGPLEQMLD